MCVPTPADVWKVAEPLFPAVRREVERAARKSRESADDLFQSGCLWLCGRLKAGTLRPDPDQVSRRLRNHFRRHTCRRPAVTFEQLPEEYDAAAPDPDEDSPYGGACLSRLDEGLARLPPRQSVAVRLRYGLDGSGERNISEVAEEMGLAKQTAARLLKKAIFRLRKEFPDLI